MAESNKTRASLGAPPPVPHAGTQTRHHGHALSHHRRHKTMTVGDRDRHMAHVGVDPGGGGPPLAHHHHRRPRPAASVAGDHLLDYPNHTSEEYLEDTGTPTPSEKVSRWHRDIFLVSPGVGAAAASGLAPGAAGAHQQVHPRQCICDICMAEYGTFKFYNQMLQKEKDGDGERPTKIMTLRTGKKSAKNSEDFTEETVQSRSHLGTMSVGQKC